MSRRMVREICADGYKVESAIPSVIVRVCFMSTRTTGGFVGKGALSAAVCGDVFSSPTQDAILTAIRNVAGPPGVLLIVKNYTGDKLNFGLAAEIAKSEGYAVEMVTVADDVALLESEHEIGARGIAGTVFLHKIVGAAAESGASLQTVAELARSVARVVKTMGVALTSCIIPTVGHPNFQLKENEIELGLGIHGEPGVRKTKLMSCDQIVDLLLDTLLRYTATSLQETKNRVALLVNNLGATPLMELAIVTRRALKYLNSKNVCVVRVYVGTFMTSLEMAGISLSLLPLYGNFLEFLDLPTEAPAWPKTAFEPVKEDEIYFDRNKLITSPILRTNEPAVYTSEVLSLHSAIRNRIDRILRATCQAINEAADCLTELDKKVGDGDLGVNLKMASQTLMQWWDREIIPHKETETLHPSRLFRLFAEQIRRCLGGTSGPLYTVFFLRFSMSLERADVTRAESWIEAFGAGVDGIKRLGESREGDRTMIDALSPALSTLQHDLQNGVPIKHALMNAAKAAEEGAKTTARMIAKRGRSTYLQERVLGHVDPGAYAVYVIMNAVAQACD
jgi:dihydroxyacetone kinase